jgi:NitT/TauT family transport system permease protein
VIGAVVGEFVSADQGLGYLINFGRGVYDTPLVIAAVFTLTALALLLYGLAAWLAAVLLVWQNVGQKQ